MKPDFGPWRMIVSSKDVTLYPDNFEHDVAITITGDFATVNEQIEYAKDIMQRLGKPADIQREGGT